MIWHIPLNGSSSKISKTDRYLKNGEVVEAARRDGRPGVLRSQLTFTPEGHVHIRCIPYCSLLSPKEEVGAMETAAGVVDEQSQKMLSCLEPPLEDDLYAGVMLYAVREDVLVQTLSSTFLQGEMMFVSRAYSGCTSDRWHVATCAPLHPTSLLQGRHMLIVLLFCRALQGEPFSAVFHDRIKLSTGGRRIKIEQKFQLLQPGVLPVKHYSIWTRVE